MCLFVFGMCMGMCMCMCVCLCPKDGVLYHVRCSFIHIFSHLFFPSILMMATGRKFDGGIVICSEETT